MEDSYHYLYPDKKYTGKNGVLINKARIEDKKILPIYESLKVSKRVEELLENPIRITDSSSLLETHHYLFQDIYDWAGKVRTVNISKDGKPTITLSYKHSTCNLPSSAVICRHVRLRRFIGHGKHPRG